MPPLTREPLATKRAAHQLLPREFPEWQAPCRKGRSPRGYPAHVRVLGVVIPLYAPSVATSRLDFWAPWRGGQAPRRRRRALAQSTPPTATTPPTASAAKVGLAGGQRHPGAQRDRLGEDQHRPAARGGDPAQLPVGVDGVRVADDLEHVHVGDRVAVGVAAGQVVAVGVGELADRARPSPRRTRSTRCRRCTCRPRSPSGSRSPGRRRASRRSARPPRPRTWRR